MTADKCPLIKYQVVRGDFLDCASLLDELFGAPELLHIPSTGCRYFRGAEASQTHQYDPSSEAMLRLIVLLGTVALCSGQTVCLFYGTGESGMTETIAECRSAFNRSKGQISYWCR